MVDFFYLGEANVFQENLDSFLKIAEELEKRFFFGQADYVTEETNVSFRDFTQTVQTNFKLSCEKEISIAIAKLQNLYAQFPHRNFYLGVWGAQLEANILVIFQTN